MHKHILKYDYQDQKRTDIFFGSKQFYADHEFGTCVDETISIVYGDIGVYSYEYHMSHMEMNSHQSWK